MKVNIYNTESNKCVLKIIEEEITIKKNRWVDKDNISHPMKFTRPVAFENKNVYFLHFFGDDSKLPHRGKHISLTFYQNQKFRWMQNMHWLQKEENIRYIINICFLLSGLKFIK